MNMTEQKIVSVTMVGVTPLLLNRYQPEGEDKIKKTDETYLDEWKRKVYLSKHEGEDVVCLPHSMIMACLLDGSKGKRKGKIYFARALYSSITPTSMHFPVFFDEKPITIDRIEREGWISAVGAKVNRGSTVVRRRPEIPTGWSVKLSFKILSNKLTQNDLMEILKDAGSCGIGDWRPSSPKKPGMYGQFEIV